MLEKVTIRIRKKLLGLVEIRDVLLSSKPFVDEIERFRKIPNVRAVVIRIDSPGGGVVPSQEIYEAIQRTRESKPVVASMGSVAASGGYYVASAAERIYASPGTLTGSIGVALTTRNVQELMSKVGIDSAVIKSGQYKDVGSPYRKMTPKEQRFLQGVSDEIYDQFVEAVAKGRGIPREKAEELADGKIYTGRRAQELGLVDQLGGLQTAIRDTGMQVGIGEEPRVVCFKRRRRFLGDGVVQAIVRQCFAEWQAQTSATQGLHLIAPHLGP